MIYAKALYYSLFFTLCFDDLISKETLFFQFNLLGDVSNKISVKCIILTTAPSTWCVIYLEHGGLYNHHPRNVKER